jgi:hypothetical protein
VFGKTELVFFLCRIMLNVSRISVIELVPDIKAKRFSLSLEKKSLAMWAVMKFYHMLRSGISWKLTETIIEL